MQRDGKKIIVTIIICNARPMDRPPGRLNEKINLKELKKNMRRKEQGLNRRVLRYEPIFAHESYYRAFSSSTYSICYKNEMVREGFESSASI